MRLAVTASAKSPGRFSEQARASAAEWGVPFVERPLKSSLQSVLALGFDAFLVLGGEGWTLQDSEGSFTFSPGIGLLRVKRRELGTQDDDVLIRLLELQPGESVLDCTLGLAADAVVCESMVGPAGKVIGVEASLAMSLLAREGLKALGSRIEVRHGTADQVLAEMADESVDCVTLDPMFEKPLKASPGFEMLRRFAVHEPISQETLRQAQRVARRWVVVKGARPGLEFKRLGLTPMNVKRGSPVMWARLPSLSLSRRGEGQGEGKSSV